MKDKFAKTNHQDILDNSTTHEIFERKMENTLKALHISLYENSLHLWCESEPLGDLKELRNSLKSLGLKWKIYKKNTSIQYAWIPSRYNKFIPSSNLIVIRENTKSKPKLKPFEINSYSLSAQEFFELISLSKNGNIPGSGVIFGKSFKWLSELLKNVFNTVKAENYLPAIVSLGTHYEARWLAFCDDKTENNLSNLTKTMPGTLFCLSENDENPPSVPKYHLTNFLLNMLVDQLVRESQKSSYHPKSVLSVQDAFLTALTSEDPEINWSPKKSIDDLADQLNSWKRPLEVVKKSSYKLCFRLSEPSNNKDNWAVEYFIQPKKSLSTIIPIEKYWNKDTQSKENLDALGKINPEFILLSLGQASSICPFIENSLKKKNPKGFKLDEQNAIVFLKNYAPSLQKSGFTVMLPAWWVKGKTADKLKVKIIASSSKSVAAAGLSLDSLMSFDYKVSIGKHDLTIQELKELVALKKELVKVRGKWIQLDHEEISKVIKSIESKKDKKIKARDLLPAVLGMDKKIDGFKVENFEVDGWMQDFLDNLNNKNEYNLIKQPDSLNGSLRSYQNRGYSWLNYLKQWNLGACLADDMGLGKTIQTLAVVQKEVDDGIDKPRLIICPTSVINNWKKEAEKFTPNLKVMIHHGSKRLKKKQFLENVTNYDLVISSYGLLNRDCDFIKEIAWSGIILDEAQNVKNSQTQQSKATRSLNADYRIALTGTPIENHIGDLWSLMEFLNPGFLGNHNSFKEQFIKPIHLYNDEIVAEKLKTITNPFILRRLKTDKKIIKDLPEKIEVKEYCSLTTEQAALYKAVIEEMKNKLETSEGIERKGLVLNLLLRLKQVCNHPVLYAQDNSKIENRSGKIQKLISLLTEINSLNEKTLIFTQFKEMGTIIQDYLQEYFGEEVFFLHGGLSKKKRDTIVEEFQAEDNPQKIFVLSLKAGGTGLNLTKANHVVHFDRWWNPAVENQATDRVFRIGQKKNVQVHKFVTSGTLEEKIDQIIEKKENVANMVIGTGESWLLKLSNDNLREIIELNTNAIIGE